MAGRFAKIAKDHTSRRMGGMASSERRAKSHVLRSPTQEREHAVNTLWRSSGPKSAPGSSAQDTHFLRHPVAKKHFPAVILPGLKHGDVADREGVSISRRPGRVSIFSRRMSGARRSERRCFGAPSSHRRFDPACLLRALVFDMFI